MAHAVVNASLPPRDDPFSVSMKDDMGSQLQDVTVIVKERSLLNSDPLVISTSIKRLTYKNSLSTNLIPTYKINELVLIQQNPVGHDGKTDDDKHEVLPKDSRDRLHPGHVSVVVPTPLSLATRCSLAGAYLLAGQKISALHR
jgi:hypothetical protein